MNRPNRILCLAAVTAGMTISTHAQVLVNDTWADGSRAEQNLPTESAWFANNISSVPTLSAAVGSMTGTVGSGSSLWITYFTPQGSPATLGVGDTLKVSLTFTPTDVGPQNTSRGMRIGLYDISNGTRPTGDGISTSGLGANANGYLLNMNFGSTFGQTSPLALLERTDPANSNLMGSVPGSPVIYTSLSSGPTVELGSGAFVGGTEYLLEYSVTRTDADSVDITTRFSGGSLDISHTATDSSGATFSFDAVAIRPNSAATSAASFQFTDFTVEIIPVPEPSTYALMALSLFGLAAWRRVRR